MILCFVYFSLGEGSFYEFIHKIPWLTQLLQDWVYGRVVICLIV
jgi:hypothetical protein